MYGALFALNSNNLKENWNSYYFERLELLHACAVLPANDVTLSCSILKENTYNPP